MSRNNKNIRSVVKISLQQLSQTHDFIEALEKKAATFVAFLSLIVPGYFVFIIQNISEIRSHTCFAWLMLLSGIVFIFSLFLFILVLKPEKYRSDPECKKFIEAHGTKSERNFNLQLLGNVTEAIGHNMNILNTKKILRYNQGLFVFFIGITISSILGIGAFIGNLII